VIPLAAGDPEAIAEIVRAFDEERARIGRVLHDEIGQILSAVGLHLDVLRLDFAGAAPGLAERTREIQVSVEAAMRQVRELSKSVDPSLPARTGLRYALEHLVARVERRGAPAPALEYAVAIEPPAGAAVGLYRIAEQAVELALDERAAAIRIRAAGDERACVLKVQYDIPSPDHSKFPDVGATARQVLLCHLAKTAGAALAIERADAGSGSVRAEWVMSERHGIRSPAG
jgi:two-component system NarL family sensor kinase